ncbi:hypothetical protein FOZ61_010228 [Perkinsus olseni]|uniref:Tyr recombinase domain-containing protein n=1 Tax=Perkinsus olseni TaxID=32597 RepID=A0A7J6KXW8_PEROL|nr:hypothetical protein FOZ61_010228 [Perkinsus olseni]KAF4651886.1 hypothetical protein FOL46_010008 [Perkinsus olseni]
MRSGRRASATRHGKAPSWTPIRGVWRPLGSLRGSVRTERHPRASVSRVPRVLSIDRAPRSRRSASARRQELQVAAAATTQAQLDDFVGEALSVSTRRQRTSAWNSYQLAVEAADMSEGDFGVTSLVTWVRAMAVGDYAFSTIQNYVGHVRRMAKEKGLPILDDRDERVLELALRAGRKIVGDPGPRKAIALDKARVLAVAAKLSPLDADILLAGVLGMCRCSELFGFLAGHLAPTAGGVSMLVAMSKTDQFAAGSRIYLGCTGHRKKNANVCEDEWCVAHRLLRRSRQAEEPDSPLFPTDKVSFAERLRAAVTAVVGCSPTEATTHMMRRSGALIYHRGGVPLLEIAEMGRWKDSTCLQGYLRAAFDAPKYYTDLTASIWAQ